MRNLTVLLVDDEYIVLKGMETMLRSQNELKLEVFTANDAYEGLEMISKIQPDMIIADINMPELDGLSMIEQAKAAGYHGQFMIVSGYEEIDYLKRAIQQQAADYLLKPVDKAKLLGKLAEVNHNQQQQRETLLFKLKMRMLNNRHAQDFNIQYGELLQLFPHKYLSLCLLPIPEEADCLHIRRQLLPYFETVFYFAQGNLTLFLLNSKMQLSRSVIQKASASVLPATVSCIGVSQCISVADFAESLTSGENPSLYSEALIHLVCSSLENNITIHPDALFTEFNSFDLLLNASQNDAAFQQYFELLLKSTSSLTDAHQKAFIEIACYNLVIFGLSFAVESLCANFRVQQQHVQDYPSLHRVLKNILANFFYYEPTITLDAKCYSDKIFQVVRVLQRDYQEDLGLEQVAEQVHLHPSYLSTMFKKETGMTFLQYLHHERMSHACDLLRENPGMSIDSIAKLVGYNTPTYFHKIFRTRFGISPNQWRQQQ